MKMYRYKPSAITEGSPFFRSIFSGAAVLPRRAVTLLLDYLEIHRQHRALEALDERMLKDIGLTRCDVAREAARPFWR